MKENTYLIGLDLGTTMLKGSAIDHNGKVVASDRVQTEYIYGENKVVEFDIELFYNKIAKLIRGIVDKLPAGAEIAGLSTASASGNTILLDKDGKPLVNAISWLDRRDKGETRTVFADFDLTKLRSIVGWGSIESFPLEHLSWYRLHKPELLDNAAHICMSTDYIVYRLTGNFMMDHSTATTFFLQDQKTRTWFKPFLEHLKIREEQLPLLRPSGTMAGRVTEQAAKETGLPVGMPVSVGAFDHPSAARGSAVIHTGEMMLSCGTSWVGFFPITDREKAVEMKLLVDPFLQPEGCWGMMFSLESVAQNINYFIDTFIDNSSEKFKLLDKYALAGVPGAHGLKIDLKNPDPAIAKESKEDLARALVEAVAERLKGYMDNLKENGISADSIKMVGGPSESECWPKLLGEILEMPVTVVNGAYSGSVGAAIMGGIGGGIFASLEDAYKQLGIN